MPATQRIADGADLKIRVPGAVKNELESLAVRHDQTLSGIVRLALRAGLPALRTMPAPGLTDPAPHEVQP
jgi:rRNA-processing protein FCF1